MAVIRTVSVVKAPSLDVVNGQLGSPRKNGCTAT